MLGERRRTLGAVAALRDACEVERFCSPLVCPTLSVLTTFPIFYAICMRNHRAIIGNVVEGEVGRFCSLCLRITPSTPTTFATFYA